MRVRRVSLEGKDALFMKARVHPLLRLGTCLMRVRRVSLEGKDALLMQG